MIEVEWKTALLGYFGICLLALCIVAVWGGWRLRKPFRNTAYHIHSCPFCGYHFVIPSGMKLVTCSQCTLRSPNTKSCSASSDPLFSVDTQSKDRLDQQ